MDQQNPGQKKINTGLKIVVLAVLVALVIIGILLPIKIVPGALSSVANTLSSLFVPKEKIKLSVDTPLVTSGSPLILRWTGQHKTNGSYTISYVCTPGVRFQASINQPFETIPCDSEYYFSPETNTVQVTAFSDTYRYADATIKLGFLENSASSVDKLGSVIVTISNPTIASSGTSTGSTSSPQASSGQATSTGSGQATTVPPRAAITPSPTPTTPRQQPSRPLSNPQGLSDLEVRIIATGYLSSTGAFVPSPTVSPTAQAAVKFTIVNVGDKNTGSWTFSADLPSATDARFTSAPQQNLGPGDRIEYTLGFQNITGAQGGFATITVDPLNTVPERSHTNNNARARFVIANQETVTAPGTQPDLTVRITATGTINRSTNQFTPANTAHAGDRVGLRFEIQNTGRTQSGSWTFRAQLPTSDVNSSTYVSSSQSSLNPGEKAVFTLGFDNIQNQGSNTATVTVDSANSISESNENNNTASVTIVRN